MDSTERRHEIAAERNIGLYTGIRMYSIPRYCALLQYKAVIRILMPVIHGGLADVPWRDARQIQFQSNVWTLSSPLGVILEVACDATQRNSCDQVRCWGRGL